MNAILGMTYLALKTDLDPRQRDYLRKIQGASEHLLGVINDIQFLPALSSSGWYWRAIFLTLTHIFHQPG